MRLAVVALAVLTACGGGESSDGAINFSAVAETESAEPSNRPVGPTTSTWNMEDGEVGVVCMRVEMDGRSRVVPIVFADGVWQVPRVFDAFVGGERWRAVMRERNLVYGDTPMEAADQANGFCAAMSRARRQAR